MDKGGHFLIFAVLGAALAWGSRRWEKRAPHLWLLLVGILFAASDELHQAFVPRRTPSVGDFVADALGLVVGYVVIRGLLQYRLRPGPSGGIPSV